MPIAGKKSKAKKKLPSKDSSSIDKKKNKKAKSIETYMIFHPDTGISIKAMGIMNNFIYDIFEKLAEKS